MFILDLLQVLGCQVILNDNDNFVFILVVWIGSYLISNYVVESLVVLGLSQQAPVEIYVFLYCIDFVEFTFQLFQRITEWNLQSSILVQIPDLNSIRLNVGIRPENTHLFLIYLLISFLDKKSINSLYYFIRNI